MLFVTTIECLKNTSWCTKILPGGSPVELHVPPKDPQIVAGNVHTRKMG